MSNIEKCGEENIWSTTERNGKERDLVYKLTNAIANIANINKLNFIIIL